MLNQKQFLLILAFLIVNISQSFAEKKENPFGLFIIDSKEKYAKSVEFDKKNQLLDLEKIIPSAVLDIRYATSDNFTKKVIYSRAKAYLRSVPAEALIQVERELMKLNLSLKIYDAYRPYQATLKFFEVLPDTNFCANPRFGSKHNRGCAVDVSLIYLNSGKDVEMPTKFDDFTPMASPTYEDLPKNIKNNRNLLINIMKKYGFKVNSAEWWHFDYENWQDYDILDLSFDELENK